MGKVLLLLGVLLLFNLSVGIALYLEATDSERLMPVRGISMMHGEPRLGVIDPGDGVIIHPCESNESIVTAEMGWRMAHYRCGYAGDVIGFHPDGDESVAICHRPLFFMRFNVSKAKVNDTRTLLMDIPEKEIFGKRSIYVETYSFSEYVFTDMLLGPYLEDSELTMESIAELENTSGYITVGDNNDGLDQATMKPVRYEWIMGKVELVENPYGAHDIISIYLLSVFTLAYLGLNIWAYRKKYEKKEYVDKRLFILFYLLFIAVYISGYVGHIYRGETVNSISMKWLLLETVIGTLAAVVWINLRPKIKPLYTRKVGRKNTLSSFVGHTRQTPVFQTAAMAFVAFAFMKTGLHIAAQTVIFVMS